MKNLTLPLLLIAATPLLGLACGSDPTTNGTTPTSTTTSTAPDGAPTGTTTATAPDGSSPQEDSGNPPGNPDAGPTTPGTVGMAGIAAWDALPAGEKAKLTSFVSLFLHQSVGQDLEDAARANGFGFEYVDGSNEGRSLSITKNGLHGGLAGSNGNPQTKTATMLNAANGNPGKIKVAILKFGYADVLSSNRATTEGLYTSLVSSLKAKGIRVLHVTPPFVFNVPSDNAPKMLTRNWMLQTFPNDVIFDLEDVESTEAASGARCERGGSWEICNSNRSTSGCVSPQGLDAPSGQGHLCPVQARRMVKAFLYSIYQAGK